MARGHEVTVVAGVHPGAGYALDGERRGRLRFGEVDGIRVIQVDVPYSNHDGLLKRSLSFLRFASHSIRLAMTESYDLLFATSTPLTAALPGIAARWLRRKRFVFEVRDLWPELPRAMGVIRNPVVLWPLSCLEWTAYKSAHGLIGLSPGIVNGIQRITGESKPVEIIPNASDTELFQPSQKDPGGQVTVTRPLTAVFTGAHGMANGLDAVLDAAQLLKDRGCDTIRIQFIGDGKLKPRLLARKKTASLDNCEFLDPMPKHELVEKLRQADVGLMVLANVPDFYKGTSPNKFFDYLAAGLPVLNNYPGWLADLIMSHECGIAIPPEDARAFANALMYLAENPQERHEMGQHARKLAKTEFARDRLAQRFIDFLERIKTDEG